MADLIAYETIRYRCPWCRKTGANKSRMARHAATCYRDPAQRACPHPDGNIVLTDTCRSAHVLAGQQLEDKRTQLRYIGITAGLFRSHFATCPNAKTHRKPPTQGTLL